MKFTQKYTWFLCGYLFVFSFQALAVPGKLWDFSGQVRELGDYTGQGKWLVVMIWASDCHVCNVEAKQYVAFHAKYKGKNAGVLGISMDGLAAKSAAEDFIEQHKINFPNLIGEPQDIADLFYDLTGVNWVGTPTFLIFAPDGTLRVQQIGAVPTDLIEEFIQKQSSAKQ